MNRQINNIRIERQSDRQTDRQRGKQTDRQADRQTGMHIIHITQIKIYFDRQTNRKI